MMRTSRPFFFATLAVMTCLALNACGTRRQNPTPTLSAETIQTIAVRDYLLGLTQTAVFLPTNTPTQTPTFTPTSTPTATRGTAVSTGVPTATCYGLTGIQDVTIPDNTSMTPGESFVKTWRVRNTGTCTWEAGFRFIFVSGDSMSGSTQVLGQAVGPGQEIDLSVPMVAPTNKTGAVRGNWRLSTAAGILFGEEQYVIIVLGTTTTTPTPTASQTPVTPSPTSSE